jgi:hypothetical protein
MYEVLHTVPVEFTFPGVGVQAMLPESAEDFLQGVEEVRDEGKGISVFLGDLVEPTVVHA